MSTEIKGIYGSQWRVDRPSDDEGCVAIDSRSGSGNRIFKVADVLNAMKAEGVLDAVEIITELPEVKLDDTGKVASADFESFNTGGDWADGSRHRKLALRRLAVARFLEARNTEAAETEGAKLRLHRQRIVSRHSSGLGAYDYDSLDTNGKYIVDTIRELEDSLAAK